LPEINCLSIILLSGKIILREKGWAGALLIQIMARGSLWEYPSLFCLYSIANAEFLSSIDGYLCVRNKIPMTFWISGFKHSIVNHLKNQVD